MLPRFLESCPGGKYPMGKSHIPISRNPHHSALLTQSVYAAMQRFMSKKACISCLHFLLNLLILRNQVTHLAYQSWCGYSFVSDNEFSVLQIKWLLSRRKTVKIATSDTFVIWWTSTTLKIDLCSADFDNFDNFLSESIMVIFKVIWWREVGHLKECLF